MTAFWRNPHWYKRCALFLIATSVTDLVSVLAFGETLGWGPWLAAAIFYLIVIDVACHMTGVWPVYAHDYKKGRHS